MIGRFESDRDPVDVGPVVVRYEPPEGISAGTLGTVVDEKNIERSTMSANAPLRAAASDAFVDAL